MEKSEMAQNRRACGVAIGPQPNRDGDDQWRRYKEICDPAPEPLTTYVFKINSELELKKVFKQIALSVKHIHDSDRAHANLTMERIYVSRSEFMILPTAGFLNDMTPNNLNKEKNISRLGEIYEHILFILENTGQPMDDWVIASHLLDLIITRHLYLEANAIIEHPYFWSIQKRLSYLCKVARLSKCKIGDLTKQENPIRRALNRRSDKVFTDHDWKIYLLLCDEEITDAKKSIKEMYGESKSSPVKKETVKQLADYPPIGHYQKNELQSLLNFVRNIWEHLWDQNYLVQACFNYSEIWGFWNFFDERFENLFVVVYDVMNEPQIRAHSRILL